MTDIVSEDLEIKQTVFIVEDDLAIGEALCDLFDSAHTHRNAAGLLYESRVWLRKKKLLNGEFVTSYESDEDSTIQASKDACNDRM